MFAKNLQGDVVAMYFITAEPPKLVATYEYDEWGKVKTVRDATGAILTDPAHLANRNPFRYRGYHYDSETGFYYLQSRYYDPTISRFINADSYATTGQAFLGTNMFAYCGNNPITYSDPTGEFGIAISAVIFAASVVVGVACAGYTAYKEIEAGLEPGQIVGDTIFAGLSGFTITYSFGTMAFQCYQNFCYLNSLTPVTEFGTTSTSTVNLYRAASPAEYTSTIQNQTFSAGGISYSDTKFFATTYNDAAIWGSKMYRDDTFMVMQASFNHAVLEANGVMYWERLDAIGPAYLIPIDVANEFVKNIG